MPYPFPVQRFREFQNWIPPEDADGIDAKESFISNSQNMDFENGFISNAPAPSEVALPTAVATLVTAGWELLSNKYFTHSERGNVEFYVLYNYTTVHQLRFFVTDSSGTTELDPDEQNSDVVYATKPTFVTYSLIDNQLKINLNVIATYNTLSKDVYANLTLVYNYRRNYFSGQGREIGWYLFPRWLGWSYTSIVNEGTGNSTTLTFETDITTGVNSETVTASSNFVRSITDFHSGIASGDFVQAGEWYKIENIVKANKLSFYFKCQFSRLDVSELGGATNGVGIPSSYGSWIQVDITDNATGEQIATSRHYGGGEWKLAEVTIPTLSDDVSITFTSSFTTAYTYAYIDDITIGYESSLAYCVIAKNYDQQRALIEAGTKSLGLGSTIRVTKAQVDWRVTNYEIYVQLAESGLYYKFMDIAVNSSGSWTDGGTYFEWTPTASDLIDLYGSGIESLNFNYGLGETTYVVNIPQEGAIGFAIYREALYRGRNYYVTYDENLYYTHISGTGLPQPDSYPMIGLTPSGYILISNQSKCLGVAVTSLDELLVKTDNKAFLYNIEYSSGGTAYRKRRAINGSFGLGSVNSLVTDLDGTPKDEVLFWTNKWGVYVYGGGIRAPKDIIYTTHRNYWKNLSEAVKAEIISFYNPQRREIWNVLDDEVMIYEIPTNTFRKYKLPFTIKEYVGEKDKYAFVLGDDNKIYKLDPKVTTRLSAFIETHYTTNTIVIGQYPIPSWEWQHKILQDIFILFKDTIPGRCTYEIIIDNNVTIQPAITFDTEVSYELLNSPLLVRYGRSKLRITVPPTTAKIREFGYSFSVPSQGKGSPLVTEASRGIGQSSGLSAGIGL